MAAEKQSNNKKEKEHNVFVMSEGSETHIAVKSFEEFSIKIKSNPSTGYSWWVKEPKDEAVVKFKGRKEDEEDEESPMFGAPSFEIFSFKALKPGETVIRLHYRRPWEKDVPPIKKHNVYVTVK